MYSLCDFDHISHLLIYTDIGKTFLLWYSFEPYSLALVHCPLQINQFKSTIGVTNPKHDSNYKCNQSEWNGKAWWVGDQWEQYCRDRQTVIVGDGSPVWDEASEVGRGGRCVDASVRQGGLESSCSVSPRCGARVRDQSSPRHLI